MQKLELLVVVGAAFVIIVRSVARRADFSGFLSVRLQLGIGFVAGLIASVVVLSDRVDLVPDTLERPIAVASVGVAGLVWGTMTWISRRGTFNRPRARHSAAGSRSSASSSESPNGPCR